MLEGCKVSSDAHKEQRMSQKEQDNKISVEKIKEKYDELYSKVESMFCLTV